jgi:hypothetical protein
MQALPSARGITVFSRPQLTAMPLGRRVSDIPDASNLHAVLLGSSSPEAIAAFYRAAGWAVRKCGDAEFEVTSSLGELVIEGSPVLVHGAVCDPAAQVDAVMEPLRANGVAFSCEGYGETGELVVEVAWRPRGR